MKEDCGGCRKGDICTLRYICRLTSMAIVARSTDGSTCTCKHRWELVSTEKTWDNLKAGDVLECKGFEDRIVQGVIGEIVLFVLDDANRTSSARSMTTLKISGYTIKQPTEEPVDKTMEEVNEKFGYEVRIKKED